MQTRITKKQNLDDCLDNVKLYKGRYVIAFYDKNGENFINMFNNVKDIAEYIKISPTVSNLNKMQVILYRAFKSESHKCSLLGEVMTVYMIDMYED